MRTRRHRLSPSASRRSGSTRRSGQAVRGRFSLGRGLVSEGGACFSLRSGVGCGCLRNNGGMMKSVEGIYRDGKVELLEALSEAEGSRVIVTFVQPAGTVNLRERGIDEPQAADLRRRLAAFAEDWDRPEMAVYDELPTR